MRAKEARKVSVVAMPNRRRGRTRAQSIKEEKAVAKVRILNKLKPRTENQSDYIRTMVENDITFCSGPPGSGKGFCAIGLACEYLLNGKVSKIILTRPTIEVGNTLGLLPGTAIEKTEPYLVPMLEALKFFLGPTELEHHRKFKNIEIVPLQHMRGMTFWNSFILCDECQDCSFLQIKTCLTRFGNKSKMVMMGDTTQSDLPTHLQGGFSTCINKLQNVEGIGISTLEICDIQRSEIVKRIVERLG